MKKVLHYVSSMNKGGEETFIMNVFRNIDRHKINFGFLYTDNNIGAYGPELKRLGGKTYHLKLNRIKGNLKVVDNYFLLKKKLKLLSKEYDYFHIHTQHAMDAYLSSLAALKAGFQHVIVHSHNSSTLYHIKAHKIFKILLHTLNITRFACGNKAGKWMFGNDDFTVVKNGISLSNFNFSLSKRKKIREAMNWEGKHIIGNIGRFNLQKNHNFLINSFNEYHKIDKNSLLVLIGTGELKKSIQKKVHELDLDKQVQFLGLRSDVNDLYQGMDLFVLPSIFEGLPVVLVEAQASDLPCVISSSITKEIDILNNVFRMSLNENPKNWALEFEKILEFPQKRSDTFQKLSNAGYDIKDVSKKLQKYYLNN